jgi:hypothetical protein
LSLHANGNQRKNSFRANLIDGSFKDICLKSGEPRIGKRLNMRIIRLSLRLGERENREE